MTRTELALFTADASELALVLAEELVDDDAEDDCVDVEDCDDSPEVFVDDATFEDD